MKIKAKVGLKNVGIVLSAGVALGAASIAHSDTVVNEFRNAYSSAETFTFEKLVTGNTYVWCGTTGDVFDENWCVWESAEVDGVRTNGILQTGDYFRTADAWNQKARLRIGSGSYTFPYVQLGKAGSSYVVVTGGVLRASGGDIQVGISGGDSTFVLSNGTVSAAYWLTAGRDAATTSRIEVHGGSLTTAYRDGVEQTGDTGNGMIDLASHANSRATFLQTGGRVHAAGSANKDDKNIAMSVGNGTDAEAAVELTGGEMDLDGHLEIPRVGTGTFAMAGGKLDVLDEIHIAAGNDSTGTLTVTGGTVNVQAFMQVARGSGSTATFAMSNSTVDVSRYVAVGFGANSTADVDVSGGTLNLKGNTEGIGFLIGDNASATHSAFKVRGNGVVNAAADSHVGWNSAGTLTIDDDGYVGVGSASNHRWLIINFGSGVSGHSIVNLDGGTLDVCHVQMNNTGDGSADVNFNGGAINVYAYNSNAGGNLFGNISGGDLRVFIKENGGTISVVEGATIAVNEPLLTGVDEGTDGGFTKDGAGTLTLAATNNTYTGSTVVKGGSLVLPEGGTLASTRLVLDGGTFTGKTFDDVTISSGSYTFSELPVSAAGTVTLNGGILRMTLAEAQATEGAATVVVNGGTVLVDADAAESIAAGSVFTFGNVTLGTDVDAGDAVKVSGVHFDWTYGSSGGHPTATAATAAGDNVWIGGSEGYWKDNVNWTYGVPSEDGTAIFNSDAHVIFDANKTVASIRVNATVTFSSQNSASVNPELLVHDVDGTGTLRLDHVGFRGNGGDKRIGTASANTFTLEFVSANTDSWLVDIFVYAPITGNGYVRLYGGTWLYGDNTSFTGKVRKDDGDVRFMAPEAGFPNAHTVDMYGTIWLWFREGEIAFGGNFTANNASRSACGINLPIGVSNVTLTLGGGNGYVNIGRQYIHPSGFTSFYGVYVGDGGSNWTAGTDKFTIRKIGSGTMNYLGVESVYNLSVEGGVAMVDPTIADPKWSNLNLTVKDGATFSVDAGISIASADFQRGSKLQSTYYETTEDETTTYGVNLLSVTGAATLDGVQLTAAGTTPNVDTVYTVLSAESVSGTAESRVDDPDDTDKKVWIAKVRPAVVSLRYGSRMPGFFINIR